MRKTHERLVQGGMPEWVDGCIELGKPRKTETWYRYWGTTGPIGIDFFPGEPAKGIKTEKRIEGEWEIIESETGALTRQVIDNDVTYCMPEYLVFPVRDRKSWEFYRDRMTPGPRWSQEQIDAEVRRGQVMQLARVGRDLTWHRERAHLTKRDSDLLKQGQDLLAAEMALVSGDDVSDSSELIGSTMIAAVTGVLS